MQGQIRNVGGTETGYGALRRIDAGRKGRPGAADEEDIKELESLEKKLRKRDEGTTGNINLSED